MPVFDDHGVRFEYPDSWELSHEHSDEDFSVTVESEHSAFWMLSVLAGRPPAEDVIEAALESFRSEYGDIDVYEASENICLLPTAGVDVDFYELEMTHRARLRVCETDVTTLLVLAQMSDTEREDVGPVLTAISQSLMYESEGDGEAASGDPFAYDNLFGGPEESTIDESGNAPFENED